MGGAESSSSFEEKLKRSGLLLTFSNRLVFLRLPCLRKLLRVAALHVIGALLSMSSLRRHGLFSLNVHHTPPLDCEC